MDAVFDTGIQISAAKRFLQRCAVNRAIRLDDFCSVIDPLAILVLLGSQDHTGIKVRIVLEVVADGHLGRLMTARTEHIICNVTRIVNA